jgi:arylsulfatase A-like enzyme
MNGVLIMSGPNVRRGMNNFDAQIMDIAPTVLYLLNEPIPQDMDGGVLLAPLSAEYIKDHPAQARWERPSAARQKQSPADSTETVNKFVEEQLKAIGYVQ